MATPNLSIQVLRGSPNENLDWTEICLASLKCAAHPSKACIDFAQHIEGNINQARIEGYERALRERPGLEWLSWVDPDDFVELHAFEELLRLGDSGVGLVTADERLVREDGSYYGIGMYYGQQISAREIMQSPRVAHKGIVRVEAFEIAKELAGDLTDSFDWALILAGTLVGEVRKIPKPLFAWRKHPNQTHKKNMAQQNRCMNIVLDRYRGMCRRKP